jgi:glucose/arabinose dehydrogenase
MNLDGTAPADNVFYDAGDGIGPRDYVYAYGVRNPFGGAWRASDGRHYEVENGSSIDRFAQVVPGRDFGWNGGDAAMFLFAIYNWNPAHAPVNLAFVQPETFGGSGFPAHLQDHAFVTESGPTYANGPQNLGKRITEYVLDANGNLASGPLAFLEYAGRGRATACGLAAGPDGLYMTELYADAGPLATTPGARILRIYYDPATDCNGNGTDDACDIASGASADENQNGSRTNATGASCRSASATGPERRAHAGTADSRAAAATTRRPASAARGSRRAGRRCSPRTRSS